MQYLKMQKGDTVLFYTTHQIETTPLDALFNQVGTLGIIQSVHDDGTITIQRKNTLGLPVNERIPQDFVTTARWKAWYNLWNDSGSMSYLLGYSVLAGIYLVYVK